jgi:hypothetical protein
MMALVPVAALLGLIVGWMLGSSRAGNSPSTNPPTTVEGWERSSSDETQSVLGRRGRAVDEGPMFRPTAAMEAARHALRQGDAENLRSKRPGRGRQRHGEGPGSERNPFDGPPTTVPPDLPALETKRPDSAGADPWSKIKYRVEGTRPPTDAPPPTREEVAALAKALTAARAALNNGKPEIARQELERASCLPMLPEHHAKFARLVLLTDCVTDFRSALSQALRQFKVGDAIPVGKSTMAGVVSASADNLTIRVAGQNMTYTVDDLPPGLVLGIADVSSKKDDPVVLVLKATYLATLRGATGHHLSTAREWLQQAAAQGAEIGDLAKVLDDTYEIETDPD